MYLDIYKELPHLTSNKTFNATTNSPKNLKILSLQYSKSVHTIKQKKVVHVQSKVTLNIPKIFQPWSNNVKICSNYKILFGVKQNERINKPTVREKIKILQYCLLQWYEHNCKHFCCCTKISKREIWDTKYGTREGVKTFKSSETDDDEFMR